MIFLLKFRLIRRPNDHVKKTKFCRLVSDRLSILKNELFDYKIKSIWIDFSENAGMIPIKICNFLQFLFSWTHESQIQIQIVWKLCCHPVGFIQQLRGQNFPFFDPLPPHFVQVVIECPLSIGRLLTVSFFWHY